MTRKAVDKPFASGTMTKAAFFSFLRSQLRRASRRWKPIYDTLAAVREPYKGTNRKLKWVYTCADCGGKFPQKEITVDHIEPVGSLKELEDFPDFIKRLFIEKEGLQALCKICHDRKTGKERVHKVQKEPSKGSVRGSKVSRKRIPKK